MEISKLTNHINFSNIFNSFEKNEDGSYNWIKIAKHPNLPLTFIDKYFFQIYQYRIEIFQQLPYYIINKYGNYLNWNLLITNQKNIDEELFEKFQNKINWKLLSKYRKLSKNFINKYKNYLDFDLLTLNDKIPNKYLKDIFI